VNQSIHKAIATAIEQLGGGVEYLVRLAQENGLNIHVYEVVSVGINSAAQPTGRLEGCCH
jgi:hypothetical protein